MTILPVSIVTQLKKHLDKVFLTHKNDLLKGKGKIILPYGTFYFLSGLIPSLLSETTWTVGRNARKSFPKVKDLGDQSAHNRRYLARKNDIDVLKRDLRITIEELIHLSKLKK